MLGRHPGEYLVSPSTERERRVIRVRRHWAVLLKVLLQTVCIIIAAFLLSRLASDLGEPLRLVQSFLWYGAGAALVRFAWNVLEWWEEILIVTDKRLTLVYGVIERKNSMMAIEKVTDVDFLSPLVGQILGYGTLRLESAGPKYALETIAYLPKPDEVFLAISGLIAGEQKQSAFPIVEQGTD